MDIKMDENLKIEFSETNRGKEQYVDALNTEQKKINVKSFIILNEKKEILNSTPFDIRPKRIFNEISKEVGERNENFMIFKNSNIIIFQSVIPTDGTFKIASKCGYQVFITKT
ncbi:hypothetical protein H8356DRAFT_1335048 [Neocallimastix lanati (nom. inval.)]|nr:hypothetical protein H8356DRAFT_1335048 [Neocallimastix sp. JGI-2020a]